MKYSYWHIVDREKFPDESTLVSIWMGLATSCLTTTKAFPHVNRHVQTINEHRHWGGFTEPSKNY